MLDLKGMTFLWPWALASLLLVPLAAWLWWRARMSDQYAQLGPAFPMKLGQEQRGINTVRYTSLGLFLLGLILLSLAIARPSALFALPLRQLDIMLALDTSGSMRADDVKPTRLVAAKQLLYPFIEQLPSHARVGLISVAATASLAQSPTTDREALRQAIERLDAQRGTALGSGLVIALSSLRPDSGLDIEKLTTGRSSRHWGPRPGTDPEPKPPEPVAPGSNESMAIIMVSDGKTTLGIETAKASQFAADLGIRVYTVGIGTAQGAVLKVDGVNQRVKLDASSLQDIAKLTLGEYFEAAKSQDLSKILNSLRSRLVLEKPKQTEVTAVFAGIGLLSLVLSALMSLYTRQRIF